MTASITHNFVSAIVDDNTPAGAVGPDEWNAGHAIQLAFTDLDDAPVSYTGHAGEVVKVNVSENGLVFGTTSGVVDFTDLGDVPTVYTGEGGKAVAVKSDETGLEFVSFASSLNAIEDKFPALRPGSPNTMDDEFDDSSGSSGSVNGLNAKWTLRGANAPTITYPASSWAKFVGNTTTFGYDQAKPAAQDYEVTMRFSIGGDILSSNSYGGLYLRDTTNGDMYTFHILVGNNNTRAFDLEVASWGNSGTFLGGAFTLLKGINGCPPPTALRIRYTNSSTALNFEASWDGGLNWSVVWTIATDAIVHDRVGFFKQFGSGGSNGALMHTMAIDWFRRTV